MSDLIVLAFDDETTAGDMLDKIAGLQKQQIITLDDAAVVVRKQDGKAKVKQATSLVGSGALGGAFWGMLIGLLFFMPWLGLAVGAISGARAVRSPTLASTTSSSKRCAIPSSRATRPCSCWSPKPPRTSWRLNSRGTTPRSCRPRSPRRTTPSCEPPLARKSSIPRPNS